MATDAFTAGYLAGSDHRTSTAADAAAEGDWRPQDGHLLCPAGHSGQNPACEWCSGWAAAWD